MIYTVMHPTNYGLLTVSGISYYREIMSGRVVFQTLEDAQSAIKQNQQDGTWTGFKVYGVMADWDRCLQVYSVLAYECRFLAEPAPVLEIEPQAARSGPLTQVHLLGLKTVSRAAQWLRQSFFKGVRK